MRKYVALVVVLTVTVIAAYWLVRSRKSADAGVEISSSAVPTAASSRAPAPATAQQSSTAASKGEPQRRTVTPSTYTVPNSPPAAAPGTSSTNSAHQGQATGTSGDESHPRTDAEKLAAIVAPTGDTEDAYNSEKLMHNRLTQESRDDTWAAQAEEQLRNYLTANMGPERLNLVSVQCGSSVCEILAATVIPGNLAADMSDWQHLLFGMARQPWWAEYQFNQPSASFRDTADHQRGLFIAFITRIAAQSSGG